MPQFAPPSPFEASLARAEQCVAAVSQALVQGDPDVLEAAASELEHATRLLATAMQGRPIDEAPGTTTRRRLAGVGQQLAMQREASVRRLSVAERAVHSIIPSTRPSTYTGAAVGYGRIGKVGGAFRAFS